MPRSCVDEIHAPGAIVLPRPAGAPDEQQASACPIEVLLQRGGEFGTEDVAVENVPAPRPRMLEKHPSTLMRGCARQRFVGRLFRAARSERAGRDGVFSGL